MEETQQSFPEHQNSPDLKQALENITHEGLRQSVETVISLGIQNADQVDYHELFGNRFLIKALTSPYTREQYLQDQEIDPDQFELGQKLILACVDAGDHIGNNSLFTRAKSLVFQTAVIYPEDGTSQKISPKLLEQLQTYNPDSADPKDKLRALELVWTTPTWLNEHADIISDLGRDKTNITIEDKKYTPYQLALYTLRKNFNDLATPETQALHTYFQSLLEESRQPNSETSQHAIKRIEQFRLLAHDHKSDELLVNFTTMHDPSIYGATLYYASRWQLHLFKDLADVFRSNTNDLEIAGKTIHLGYGKVANPRQFAQAMVKLTKPGANLSKIIRTTQRSALKICPSCYGYGAGFRSQAAIQSNGSHSSAIEQSRTNSSARQDLANRLRSHFLFKQ